MINGEIWVLFAHPSWTVPSLIFFSFPILQGNHAIKNLNLSQNLLIDLDPQVFRHLGRLETLDLSSNFLMGLSEEFFREAGPIDYL